MLPEPGSCTICGRGHTRGEWGWPSLCFECERTLVHLRREDGRGFCGFEKSLISKDSENIEDVSCPICFKRDKENKILQANREKRKEEIREQIQEELKKASF